MRTARREAPEGSGCDFKSGRFHAETSRLTRHRRSTSQPGAVAVRRQPWAGETEPLFGLIRRQLERRGST